LKVLPGYCGKCTARPPGPAQFRPTAVAAHLLENSHLADVRHSEELGSIAGAAARVDERANVRRHDLFEALQGVEAVDFLLIGGDFRIGGVEPRHG
jgi:hypothetical protein